MANLLPTIHLLAPVRLVMGLLIPARLVVLDMVDFIFYGVGGCEITCIVVLQQILDYFAPLSHRSNFSGLVPSTSYPCLLPCHSSPLLSNFRFASVSLPLRFLDTYFTTAFPKQH